jgi:carbon storage regulator
VNRFDDLSTFFQVPTSACRTLASLSRKLARHLYCEKKTIQIKHQNQGSEIMLVLSRKENEQLLIGDNIVLTINRISGNRVAIGIDAPRDVRIVRGELRRHELPAGGSAPMEMETNVAVASKPH